MATEGGLEMGPNHRGRACTVCVGQAKLWTKSMPAYHIRVVEVKKCKKC